MLTPVRQTVRTDDRPAYRPFGVEVARTVREGDHLVRVTLTGPELHWFGAARADQRVKLLLPLPDGHLTEVGADDDAAARSGSWYERWRAAPPERRSPMRTYTVRAARPHVREVDLLMVVHGDAGPASRWARLARRGDRAVLVGPDARSAHHAGIDWEPGTATDLLLAGDETAVPAICSILEALPPGRRTRAFLEVPAAGDILDTPAGTSITWLPREGTPHGGLLVPAVRDWVHGNAATVAESRAIGTQELEDVDVDRELLWDSPVLDVQPVDSCGRGERCGSDFYAWFAGEAAVIRELRRILVSEVGVCRRRVAFMGYWRAGRAELP